MLSGKDNGHLCLAWKYGLKHASYNGSASVDKFKTKYNFKKENYDGMWSFFDRINWSEIFDKKMLVIVTKNSCKYMKMSKKKNETILAK